MRYMMAMRKLPQVVLLLLLLSSVPAIPQGPVGGRQTSVTQSNGAGSAMKDASPVLLTPSHLEPLLPATVYFRGKSAPIQLRNAAGARFGPDGFLLAAMVDTSGYASSVQETYQFYFITETALMFGGHPVSAGAYGAGVVNGKFILMDIGGHELLRTEATLDQAMPRPRPLQLVIDPSGGLKLYLGRSWIALAAGQAK